jgi:integrase
MKLNKYTPPRIVKGRKPRNIPKGSNLEKEMAKNIWYINFSFNGKQYRFKNDINRIKDAKEKNEEAETLLDAIKKKLKEGWNPANPKEYYGQQNKESILLSEAIAKYLEEIKGVVRTKTYQSYASKLRHFADAMEGKVLQDVVTKDIVDYIRHRINGVPSRIFSGGKYVTLSKDIQWTPNTVRTARGVFSAFFAYCKKERYIEVNPCETIERKEVRSEIEVPERNIPFSKEDFIKILAYLDENDRFSAFFTRMIYYTCMRPKEISMLRLRDVDMENREIVVRLMNDKNTKGIKPARVPIDDKLFKKLSELNLQNYPSDYFLCSNPETIIGPNSIGTNTPYKRFRKALVNLELDKKGYTLYAAKHYSNIRRYTEGRWTIAQIQLANRHKSVRQTEQYLRNMTRTTDITGLAVPEI